MGTDTLTHDSRPTPFIGARPFTVHDEKLFFGRAEETVAVGRLWLGGRLTILHGASGVGKTSLLAAGVIPRLTADGAHVLPFGHAAHSTAFPVAALPEQNPYVLSLLTSWFPDEPQTLLSEASISQCFARHARRDRFGAPSPILMAVDRAERLFRPSPAAAHESQRRQALDQLAEALTSRPAVHLLMALRDDMLDEALGFAGALGSIGFATSELRPLGQDAALEVVSRTLVTRRLEPSTGAVRGLVEELRTIRTSKGSPTERISEVDPGLLQVVCARLWERLAKGQDPPRGRLADEIDQALAECCAQSLATIAVDHRLPPRELISWFRASFGGQRGVSADQPPDRGRPVRIPLSVLRAAEDRHLIRSRRLAGKSWYELNPRLSKPIDQMDDDPRPMRGPDPPARLAAARSALADNDHTLARHHVQAAIRACRQDQMRTLADAESILGNIAYELSDLGAAATHYRNAASMYETMHDTRAVGRLLTALGRLKLIEALEPPPDATTADSARTPHASPATGRSPGAGDGQEPVPEPKAWRQALAAVTELGAAAERVPNDTVVQTLLGQALWHAGQPHAALAALTMAIGQDCGDLHALRVRGEYLADLGSGHSALQDLQRVEWQARPGTMAAWALAWASAGLTPDRTVIDELTGLACSAPGSDAGASGPFLLRVARLHGHAGADAAATRFADRALASSRPPLPPHLVRVAHELIGSASPQ